MTKAAIACYPVHGMDHAHQGIRVMPSAQMRLTRPCSSGLAQRGFDPDSAVWRFETVPLGRIAEPEDIADVVLFRRQMLPGICVARWLR